MTARTLGYKRLVLGLQAGAPNRATRLAVEFAELFDAELLGLFFEDVGLRHLAEIPFARAISSPGADWSWLEPEQASLYAGGRRRQRSAPVRRMPPAISRGGGSRPCAAARRGPSSDLAFGRHCRDRRSRSSGRPRRRTLCVASGRRVPLDRSGNARARARRARRRLDRRHCRRARRSERAGGGRDCLRRRRRPRRPRSARGSRRRHARRAARRRGGHGVSPNRTGPVNYAAGAAPQALRGLTERLAVVTRGAVGNDIALSIALARGVPVLSIDLRERGRGDR